MSEPAEENEEEPSIEEILDSIRQIIADEDEEDVSEPVGDFGESEPAVEVEATPEPEPKKVEVAPEPEPEAIEEPEPEPEPEEEIVDLTEKVEKDEHQIESPIEIDMVDLDDILSDEDDHLLSDTAESAAVDAITQLARKTAVEYNGVTLEDIVRSEIKPMLRDWLDKNLPKLIERLVQEELERVSKRVLDE